MRSHNNIASVTHTAQNTTAVICFLADRIPVHIECIIIFTATHICTGKTATTAQAEEVCKAIRDCVREVYGEAVADSITVQYGGSVKASNAAELFAEADIDGGLVGGASLKADEFKSIVIYK